MKWSLRVSVMLAKRGARVALARAAAISNNHVAGDHRRSAEWSDGPLGAMHAVDPISIHDTGT